MKFISISGADACGKDTQIDRLEKYFVKLGKKTQILSLDSSLKHFEEVLTHEQIADVHSILLLQFEPLARTLFLQSLIKNALDQIKPDTQIVIFNGYWYKFAASEAAYGVPLTFWTNSASDLFPKPDVSIHLQVPIETCFKRRRLWTPYEMGHGRYWGTPPLSFESFQTKVHEQFLQLFQPLQIPVIQIDGDHPEEQVARNISSLFDESPIPKSSELVLSSSSDLLL